MPNVGKSTLFNCLSNAKAQSANFPFCTIEPNIGRVNVPDVRLEKITKFIVPQSVIPAVMEFKDIAERFVKLRYNCLAVDLRSGDNSKYIRNETAQSAREQNASANFLDALPDIRAAIDFAWELNPKELILLGSSYSASLIMLEGADNPNVRAMIAFSPGEYFGDELRMEESLDSLDKPLFIAVTDREEPYVKQMMSNIPEEFHHVSANKRFTTCDSNFIYSKT